MSDTNDQFLECQDCGASFLWTARDQAFYLEQKFSKPVRCKPCRIAKKQRFEAPRSGAKFAQ